MAEIELLRLKITNVRHYWNSTTGFDFDHLAVKSMLFCISVPNFVQIGAPTAEI